MSWDGNDQAPLDEEGQVEDVIDDSARGVQGLIQDCMSQQAMALMVTYTKKSWKRQSVNFI
jgi:hypothetical protein